MTSEQRTCYGDHTAEAKCITCPHLGDCWIETTKKLRAEERKSEQA